MKKAFSLLVFLAIILPLQLNAQCTPNPFIVALGIPGFYPNPVNDSLDDGQSGVMYDETITVIIPADTTITPPPPLPPIPLTVQVKEFDVVSVDGLPPGLMSVCDNINCNWTGGDNGCVRIFGTPTTPGEYTIEISFSATVDLPQPIGQLTLPPIQPLPYDVTIDFAAGLQDELNETRFEVAQNIPNPASATTTIHFTSPLRDEVQLSVFNMVGQVFESRMLNAIPGENEVELDLNTMSAGIYFYSLSNGSQTITKKLIVE